MTKDNNIKKELIEHMNNGNDKSSNNVKIVQDILVKDATRIKHMKWLAIFAWIAFGSLFVAGNAWLHQVEHSGNILNPAIAIPAFRNSESTPSSTFLTWTPIVAVSVRAVLLIAIVSTISFRIRSKTLSMRQILMRLSAIEEAITRMSVKD